MVVEDNWGGADEERVGDQAGRRIDSRFRRSSALLRAVDGQALLR
jgi:hypothetical protein